FVVPKIIISDAIEKRAVIADIEVEDDLTTDIELQPILNESVKELLHFLEIVEKVPTEEVEDEGARSNNTSKNNSGFAWIWYQKAHNVVATLIENKTILMESTEEGLLPSLSDDTMQECESSNDNNRVVYEADQESNWGLDI
ncbi:hypothetical protein Gohar_017362, partial [Gossypium harknessii]|nr:hypothetical protein [Gossypium harknessii]